MKFMLNVKPGDKLLLTKSGRQSGYEIITIESISDHQLVCNNKCTYDKRDGHQIDLTETKLNFVEMLTPENEFRYNKWRVETARDHLITMLTNIPVTKSNYYTLMEKFASFHTFLKEKTNELYGKVS